MSIRRRIEKLEKALKITQGPDRDLAFYDQIPEGREVMPTKQVSREPAQGVVLVVWAAVKGQMKGVE